VKYFCHNIKKKYRFDLELMNSYFEVFCFTKIAVNKSMIYMWLLFYKYTVKNDFILFFFIFYYEKENDDETMKNENTITTKVATPTPLAQWEIIIIFLFF